MRTVDRVDSAHLMVTPFLDNDVTACRAGFRSRAEGGQEHLPFGVEGRLSLVVESWQWGDNLRLCRPKASCCRSGSLGPVESCSCSTQGYGLVAHEYGPL